VSDQEALDRFVELLDGLAGRLHDAAAGIRLLAADVAVDWADPRGREWTAQAELLHRDVDRQAEDSGGLARRIADGIGAAVTDVISTAFADAKGPVPAEALGTSPAAASGADLAGRTADAPAGAAGPRLAGTDGKRVPPGWGMRLGVLPESP
jgi:hypothetical protein